MKDEGHFLRSDGSEPKFFNWHRGEPDNEYGASDCVEVDYHPVGNDDEYNIYKWNDIPCNPKRLVICEKPCVPVCKKGKWKLQAYCFEIIWDKRGDSFDYEKFYLRRESFWNLRRILKLSMFL